MIGERIGPYEINEKIGEGGMGVVYKAEDTRLKRTVALKFLPQDLTRSAEARERFIHEAQAASAMDHPNICTIYEINETDEGQVYIAMTYYEGETLREKIAERPLKLEDAIDITSQIAQGLAKAHEQKIIHRDIKPANIFITEEGQVKILDFGVAKLAGSTKLTLTGTTLGTVSYMAPEQARGDEADHKADIWSLGILMYEMLTGQQPFQGEHEQSVIYSILNDDPEPITALRTGIPIDLEWVVQKAIRKNPKERYQHVDEIPVDLKAIGERKVSTSSAVVLPHSSVDAVGPSFNRRRIPPGVAVATATIVLVTGFLVGRFSIPGTGALSGPLLRFEITLPEMNLDGSGSQVAVSPDGKYLVYQAEDYSGENESVRQLYLRSLDSLEMIPLPDTQYPAFPTFSPEGDWIGFLDYHNNTLKKLLLESQRTITICEVGSNIWGMDWGPDDTIIYSPRGSQRIMLVSASEGTPREVAIADSVNEFFTFRWPQFLPGGREVLLTFWRDDLNTFDSAQIGVLSLRTGRIKTLVAERAAFARYIPTIRHLIYIKDGNLTAVPFSLRRLEVTGREIASGEIVQAESSGCKFHFSDDGVLAYVNSAAQLEQSFDKELYLVNYDGTSTRLDIAPRYFGNMRISPDGEKIAIEIRSGADGSNDNIWIYDLDGSGYHQLTYEGSNRYPVWSADGNRVAFSSNRTGNTDIYIMDADRSGEAEQLVGSDLPEHPVSWSPDGIALAYTLAAQETGTDLWLYNKTDNSTYPFLDSRHGELEPVISPDSRWIAYISHETEAWEVYVKPRPEIGRTGYWRISEGGGTGPLWAPDGRTIYYRKDDRVMAVDVELEPGFSKGIPRLVFEGKYVSSNARHSYDIHPNGTQFIMAKYVEARGTNVSTINIVTNWFQELKRLQGGR